MWERTRVEDQERRIHHYVSIGVKQRSAKRNEGSEQQT